MGDRISRKAQKMIDCHLHIGQWSDRYYDYPQIFDTVIAFRKVEIFGSLLEKMKRGHSAECVENAVRLLKNAGISVGLQFMTGFPYENEEDVEISAKSLEILRPDFIRIYPFVPLKNTPVEREISSAAALCPLPFP